MIVTCWTISVRLNGAEEVVARDGAERQDADDQHDDRHGMVGFAMKEVLDAIVELP